MAAWKAWLADRPELPAAGSSLFPMGNDMAYPRPDFLEESQKWI